jgi:hypothetical protein
MNFRIAFYKGTHPGLPGVYNRLVRARGHGPYSHVELIFSDGWAASSSWMDGGVRFKQIDFDTQNWDILELPGEWESFARLWFATNEGKAYDLMGNAFLAIGFVSDSFDKFFCSEAAAAALKIDQAFRLEPNTLYPVVKRMVEIYHEQRQLLAA